MDHDWPVVVVGIGNLGRALVNSAGFSSRGFRIAALFDTDPAVVGQPGGAGRGAGHGHPGRPGGRGTGGHRGGGHAQAAAQEVTDQLIDIGVRSILNFAPTVLSVPAGVLLRYVDLSIELQVMSFYLSRRPATDRPAVPVPSARSA